MDCLFCKIVNILIVPKKHIGSLAEAQGNEDKLLLGHLLALVQQIARSENLTGGYRTVINTGSDGGQTVDHLHLHLLGGRAMHWPPG
jgi:histidine triad (HIT) family protein